MANKELTDGQIARIGGRISSKDLKMVAITYKMTIEQAQLDNITTSAYGNQDQVVREILLRWRNSTGATVQELADILHDSGLVTDDVIKKELGVDAIQFNNIQFGNPSDNPALEEWELGRLAKQINRGQLVSLATKYFDEQLTNAQISNIGSNNAGDAWSASFEILVHWSRKTGNNRKKLKRILKESKALSPEGIKGLLGPGDINNLQESLPIPETGTVSCSREFPEEGATSSQSTAVTSTDEPGEQPGPDGEDVPDSPRTVPGEEVYPMNTNPVGYLLMINIKEFKDSAGNIIERMTRYGTDEDAMRLRNVFSRRDFKIIEKKDLSAKLIVAVIKAFTNKDELRTSEQIEAFLKQFQLNELTMKEIEGDFATHGTNALKRLKFNADDIAEFEKEFKVAGREAFKRRCKFTEREMKQIEADISKIRKTGKQAFEAKYKLVEEDINEIEASFRNSELSRESLVCKFKFNEVELQELEEKFHGFGREALIQKYKLKDSEMTELRNTIDEFKQHTVQLHNTSSLIVAVMSHGENGKVYGSDMETVELDHFFNEFSSDNCSALALKPKMFLIQACRGPGMDVATDDATVDEVVELDFITEMGQAVPRFADMITGYATNPGLVSTRKSTGSFFIQTVCKVLSDCHDDMDVLAMTLKVNQKVANESIKVKGIEIKQMAEFLHTLRKPWRLPKPRTP